MIYAIGDGNKVKIGYSKNPQKRLKQLQTGQPNKLKLLHTWEGDKLAEKKDSLYFKTTQNYALI